MLSILTNCCHPCILSPCPSESRRLVCLQNGFVPGSMHSPIIQYECTSAHPISLLVPLRDRASPSRRLSLCAYDCVFGWPPGSSTPSLPPSSHNRYHLTFTTEPVSGDIPSPATCVLRRPSPDGLLVLTRPVMCSPHSYVSASSRGTASTLQTSADHMARRGTDFICWRRDLSPTNA